MLPRALRGAVSELQEPLWEVWKSLMTRLGNSFGPSRGGAGQTAAFHSPLPKYSRRCEEFPPWRWAGLQGSVNSRGIQAGILPGASALERLRGRRRCWMGTAGGSGDAEQLPALREARAPRGFSEPCSGLGAQPRALPSSREMLRGRRGWDGLEALRAAAASPELPGILLSLECQPVVRPLRSQERWEPAEAPWLPRAPAALGWDEWDVCKQADLWVVAGNAHDSFMEICLGTTGKGSKSKGRVISLGFCFTVLQNGLREEGEAGWFGGVFP